MMRWLLCLGAVLTISLFGLHAFAADPSVAEDTAKSEIHVTWLGHSAFQIITPGGTRLIIDPFLKRNPATPRLMRNLDLYRADAILVTHGHGDHAADAKELAQKTSAKVIGESHYVGSLRLPKKQQMGGKTGDAFYVGDVSIHLVPAVHDSDHGHAPLGFVIRFADGRTMYHSGDTSIFDNMSEIQKEYQPDIILIQAGGGPYNQDPTMAANAINTHFNPSAIIPMHYGTWPVLASEGDVRDAFEGDERLKITKPGETISF